MSVLAFEYFLMFSLDLLVDRSKCGILSTIKLLFPFSSSRKNREKKRKDSTEDARIRFI